MSSSPKPNPNAEDDHGLEAAVDQAGIARHGQHMRTEAADGAFLDGHGEAALGGEPAQHAAGGVTEPGALSGSPLRQTC